MLESGCFTIHFTKLISFDRILPRQTLCAAISWQPITLIDMTKFKFKQEHNFSFYTSVATGNFTRGFPPEISQIVHSVSERTSKSSRAFCKFGVQMTTLFIFKQHHIHVMLPHLKLVRWKFTFPSLDSFRGYMSGWLLPWECHAEPIFVPNVQVKN